MYQKLEKLLEGAEGVLLTSPHNLRYFTGFRGGEGIAAVTKQGRWLFVDSRYTQAAQEEAPGYTVIEPEPGKQNAVIGEYLRDVRSLAFEDQYLTVERQQTLAKAWGWMQWVGSSGEIEKLRMVKTEEELACIRRAEQIGIEAYRAALPLIKPGLAETELAAELEYQMRRRGSQGTSFDTIAISGPKTSMPHGITGGRTIAAGDLVTMDFGCRYEGYCSDMTRTVAVGKIPPELKKIYRVVQEAQECGLMAIRPGIRGREADARAREVIAKAGYGQYFRHALGHGVGLLIHEQPTLSAKSETVLEPGMVVSCEPGIYIPGLGGVRIEDLVCVTQDGIENFTPLSKELLEL